MRFLLPVVVFVFLVFPSGTLAASEQNPSLNFWCRSAWIRELFNLNCPDAAFDTQPDENKSIKLQFFDLPSPTPTHTPIPTSTPTPSPGYTNPNPSLCQSEFNGTCRSSCSAYEINKGISYCGSTNQSCCVLSSATPTPQSPTSIPSDQPTPFPADPSSTTEQVDWVYHNEGVCWSAWAKASCNLLPHEGGKNTGSVDITGDGTADITCSQGDGSSQSTTITNISSQVIELRCERYACNSCKSGNGTHAQCDQGNDPSADRVAQEYSLAPGTSAACTKNGIGVSQPNPNTPTPTSTPAPTHKPIPSNPPQKPTPTLPSGQLPPITTRCRLGTGYCSVENLQKYFPNYTAAYKASVVCQGESASNPLAGNKACTTGRSVDYSIGLFQINALAHCEGAMTYTSNPPSCRIINQTALDKCVQQYQDPDYNIRKAVALSKNGTDWYPTWGAAGPAYCNIP